MSYDESRETMSSGDQERRCSNQPEVEATEARSVNAKTTKVQKERAHE